ncbi:trypsin CFT-1-like [Anticarsia gemmatalis]|uniref:trypsin CFT-1-like n=1 Tax=Anticarsia gemmatalis TaxID=129554 RepID=UPI003F771D81
MRATALLALCVAAVSAGVPRIRDPKIIGGSITTIDNYPEATPLLYAFNQINFRQMCGGSILNQRAILTAAHCVSSHMNFPHAWRMRVGSSFALTGGVLHACKDIIIHPDYDLRTSETDIAIMHSLTHFVYINNAVQPARIAGTNYHLADNEEVWAVGWGVYDMTTWAPSEQLRHVQLWTVNQEVCRERYVGRNISDNMLCAGWLDVGGRDTCRGDSGSPLYHYGVVVGICSFGRGCADPEFPGVSVRVTQFTPWIQENA